MIKYAVFEKEEDWKQFRAGLFTASDIYRLMTEPKKKDDILSVGAKTYITEKVAEIIAPLEPSFYNSAMEHGNETEPMAVLRIAKELGKSIDDDDFIYKDKDFTKLEVITETYTGLKMLLNGNNGFLYNVFKQIPKYLNKDFHPHN